MCHRARSTRRPRTAARFQPGPVLSTTAGTKLGLRVLGERCAALDAELARLDAELDRLTAQAAPRLRQLCGVGPEIAGALLVAGGDNPRRLHSEAAFSMLCGASLHTRASRSSQDSIRPGTPGACSRGQQRSIPVAHGVLRRRLRLGERYRLTQPGGRDAVYGMQEVEIVTVVRIARFLPDCANYAGLPMFPIYPVGGLFQMR
jgi:hypothetical protein